MREIWVGVSEGREFGGGRRRSVMKAERRVVCMFESECGLEGGGGACW